MAIKIYNPTEKFITLYSGDQDSVTIYPLQSVPVDDKFKDRLPDFIKNRLNKPLEKIFLPSNPITPVIPVSSVVQKLYSTGFI